MNTNETIATLCLTWLVGFLFGFLMARATYRVMTRIVQPDEMDSHADAYAEVIRHNTRLDFIRASIIAEMANFKWL
jgi:hypothetical protein